MTGRQLNFAIKGDNYEKAFDAIASRFLSVVRTPGGANDYGIDAFCHVRTPLDAISSAVGGTFGVQVRGPGEDLQFGGTDKNDRWKGYEVEWLRTLAVPLYLARVSSDCIRIDLYSLWPIWLVLAQSSAPFQIVCRFDEPTEQPRVVDLRSAAPHEKALGDGKVWSVPLGPPFLSFAQGQFGEPAFASRAVALMNLWLSVDRRNTVLAALGVRYVEGIKEWATNDSPETIILRKQFMAWSDSREKVVDLARSLEPILINLGVHLQRQDDSDVYRLIPALDWLDSLTLLTPMGKGLLNGIRGTQAAGISPRLPTAE
jgi:hypothetical protein